MVCWFLEVPLGIVSSLFINGKVTFAIIRVCTKVHFSTNELLVEDSLLQRQVKDLIWTFRFILVIMHQLVLCSHKSDDGS
jgi:hypothetical protein